MKKGAGPVAEAAAPIRSLAPPPTNMAQANNARGEGKVNTSVLCSAQYKQAAGWLIGTHHLPIMTSSDYKLFESCIGRLWCPQAFCSLVSHCPRDASL